ncbi:lasso RiPP family leader peptide-containing protein [Actinophytocola sp.]
MKNEYVPPTIEEIGSLPELTLGGSAGSRLDADFAAGTLFGELTFS